MMLSDPESGRGDSGMTATARRARGRGLAWLVKHHGLARAAARRARAWPSRRTTSTNAPMLAVNQRLGYRPAAANATFTRRS